MVVCLLVGLQGCSCLPRRVPACPPGFRVWVRYLAALDSVPRRVSSSLAQGWDRSLASLSAFSNFPILPSGSKTPRAFIAAQLLSNHLPRSFFTDQGVLSLNLFRADAPRSKPKVIGPTAPGHG